MTNLNIKNKKIIQVIPFLWILIICTAGYYYKNSYGEIIRNSIMALFSFYIFNIVLNKDIRENNILFENAFSYLKLFFVSVITMIIAVIFPVFPISGWFYPLIYIYFLLLIAPLSAIVISSIFVMVSVMFSNVKYGVFALYFLAGVAAVIVFSDFYKNVRKTFYFLIVTVIQFITLSLMTVFYLTAKLDAQAFIVPVINIVICTTFIIFLANYYSSKYNDVWRKKFLKINDQTHVILKALKDADKEEYFMAIHTSYFANVIAESINADRYLCKGGGYYYNINSFKIDKEIIDNSDFPKELNSLIDDLQLIKNNNANIESKEEFAIFIGRNIVEKIIESGKKISQYESIINCIFDDIYKDEKIMPLNMTFNEFNKCKEALLSSGNYIKVM